MKWIQSKSAIKSMNVDEDIQKICVMIRENTLVSTSSHNHKHMNKNTTKIKNTG